MTIPLGYNVVGLTQGTGRMSFMQFVMAIDRCGGWQPLVDFRISPAFWPQQTAIFTDDLCCQAAEQANFSQVSWQCETTLGGDFTRERWGDLPGLWCPVLEVIWSGSRHELIGIVECHKGFEGCSIGIGHWDGRSSTWRGLIQSGQWCWNVDLVIVRDQLLHWMNRLCGHMVTWMAHGERTWIQMVLNSCRLGEEWKVMTIPFCSTKTSNDATDIAWYLFSSPSAILVRAFKLGLSTVVWWYLTTWVPAATDSIELIVQG